MLITWQVAALPWDERYSFLPCQFKGTWKQHNDVMWSLLTRNGFSNWKIATVTKKISQAPIVPHKGSNGKICHYCIFSTVQSVHIWAAFTGEEIEEKYFAYHAIEHKVLSSTGITLQRRLGLWDRKWWIKLSSQGHLETLSGFRDKITNSPPQ